MMEREDKPDLTKNEQINKVDEESTKNTIHNNIVGDEKMGKMKVRMDLSKIDGTISEGIQIQFQSPKVEVEDGFIDEDGPESIVETGQDSIRSKSNIFFKDSPSKSLTFNDALQLSENDKGIQLTSTIDGGILNVEKDEKNDNNTKPFDTDENLTNSYTNLSSSPPSLAPSLTASNTSPKTRRVAHPNFLQRESTEKELSLYAQENNYAVTEEQSESNANQLPSPANSVASNRSQPSPKLANIVSVHGATFLSRKNLSDSDLKTPGLTPSESTTKDKKKTRLSLEEEEHTVCNINNVEVNIDVEKEYGVPPMPSELDIIRSMSSSNAGFKAVGDIADQNIVGRKTSSENGEENDRDQTNINMDPETPALLKQKSSYLLNESKHQFLQRRDSFHPPNGIKRLDSTEIAFQKLFDREYQDKQLNTFKSVESGNTLPPEIGAILRTKSVEFNMPYINEDAVKGSNINYWYTFFVTHWRTILILILLGILMSGVEHSVTFIVKRLLLLRFWIGEQVYHNFIYTILAMIGYTVPCMLLSIFFTNFIDQKGFAVGSGLPLLRYLFYNDLNREADERMGFHTLIARIIGQIFAVAAGLTIGREGPNVHIACIMAWQLMKKVPIFHSLYRNNALKRQIIDAACAVGVSATFAAPIGGVLFSIEVTTNYYETSNYWKCFLASICGYACTRCILHWMYYDTTRQYTLIAKHIVNESMVGIGLIPIALFLGIAMGLIGPLYIELKRRIALRFRKQYAQHFSYKYIIGGCCALLVSLIYVTFDPFGTNPMIIAMSHLFANEQLPEVSLYPWNNQPWSVPSGSFYTSLVYSITLIVTSALSTNLPVPCGDFMPLLAIGAAIGRFIGEVVIFIFPHLTTDYCAILSVVGAASLAGSATQTISAAIIVLELTAEFHLLLPLLIGTMTAYLVSRGLSRSIYDVMMITSNYRFLPSLSSEVYYKLKAEDVMDTSLKSIPLIISYAQVIYLLRDHPLWKYPVVTEENEFLGLVKRNDILQHLESEFIREGVEDTLPVLLPLDFILPSDTTNTLRDRFSFRKSLPAKNGDLSHDTLKRIREITERTLDLRITHSIVVNPSAYRVSEKQPITEIYALMDLLRCPCVYVVSYGVLVGVISRKILSEFVEDLNNGKANNVHYTNMPSFHFGPSFARISKK